MRRNSLGLFNGFIGRRNLRAPASASPSYTGSLINMAATFGVKRNWTRVALFSLISSLERRTRCQMCHAEGNKLADRTEILLVEDNANDAELTLHALRKENLANHIHVAHDGEEALDFLFSRAAYKDRPAMELPRLILLDLKLPKVDGLSVLRQVKVNHLT